MQSRVAFGGGSVMVWGGISISGKTELFIIRNGTLTAQCYIDEILNDHVRPLALAVTNRGENFVLMQDGARAHSARVVTQYLADNNIEKMEWPACSPDLNPIEHLWDQLGQRIRNRMNPPVTIRELEDALVEDWQQIPQESIRRLIRSMPRRCQGVLDANGGNTRY